jgi:GNAT superfamily N-acetyltransferase
VYLGRWPPRAPVEVVGSRRRLERGWDESVVLAVVVTAPVGTVISVPPAAVEETRPLVGDLRSPGFGAKLAATIGAPRRASPWLVMRWTGEPAPLPDVGRWIERSQPGVPDWLQPFPDPVLAVFDEQGAFMAGLGIKPHTDAGWELAVGTEERARGRGLARRLVAQAAREVLARGAVPLYVHHPENIPSARAADGAGFPDSGWRMVVVATPPDHPS